MKLLSLLLLAVLLLVGKATAYSTTGAYERLWYYYAYLVDTDGGKTAATKIAPGCSSFMNTKGRKPCSFNEFIEYIARIEKDAPKPDFKVTNDLAPDLEETAKLLQEKGLTGPYHNYRIREGINNVNAYGVAQVMESITGFLQGKLGDYKEYQEAISKATTAVARLRTEASVKALADALREDPWKFKEVFTKKTPLWKGATETFDDLDFKRTLKANPHKTIADVKAAAASGAFDPDQGHKACFRAAQKAAQGVSEACS